VEDDIDALFKLPLREFTPARNALAARLKKAGEKKQADEVKVLPKPSVAAWVVNQLYWQHREAFDRLIEAGDRFRSSPADRERLEARRTAQSALVQIAEGVLQDAGSGGAQNMLRRVTSTLEALATYGSLPNAPRAGRLSEELTPPGFDVLAGLLPPSAKAGHKPASASAGKRSRTDERATKVANGKAAREEGRRRRAAEAKAAVREAERALRTARTQAERAAAALDSATQRAEESERRRAKAEKELAKVAAEANASRKRASEAEASAKQASQAAASAERALEQARGSLNQLEVN
jgi:hypothetical protein